jgi:UDP-glucuronate 4-epimerase
MKIIVTGGAGFIGSHLSQRLIGSSHRVFCIDNFDSFYDPRIKKANIEGLLASDSFSLIESDICTDKLKDIVLEIGPDLIIHLAARAGVRPSIADPALYERVNIAGTINLLEAARKAGVSKVMFASSSSVYGGNKKVPFSEEDRVDMPVSPYAATKKAGELICHTYSHLYLMDIFCFRFFTVYGPRQRPEMAIHKFSRKVFNGKRSRFTVTAPQ